MLRAIEYTLLGASLLVVIGLIFGGSRRKPDLPAAPPPAPPGESDVPQPQEKAP